MKGSVGSDEGKIWVRCTHCGEEWSTPISEGVNVRCKVCGQESNAAEAASLFRRLKENPEQAAMAQLVGAGRLLWGSDWPHYEGHTNAFSKMKRNVAALLEEDQRKILGENALAMYGLS